jgi:CrcB protein
MDPDTGATRVVEGPPPPVAPSHRATAIVVAVVAASGAVGSLARYGMSEAIASPSGAFPWGTFWVNVAGSLAIGFVLVLVVERFPRARLARPLIATGFIGAFTTFSTYVVGAVELVRDHHVATAVAYALSSLVAGLAAVAAGMLLGRLAVRVDRVLDAELAAMDPSEQAPR